MITLFVISRVLEDAVMVLFVGRQDYVAGTLDHEYVVLGVGFTSVSIPS